MRRSEEAIYKANYVTLTINADGGTHAITFDNHQIREDVVYFDGRATEVFKTPTGEGTSMARLLPKYFKFIVRYYENEEAHNNVNLIRYLTQYRYTASFSLNPFMGAYSAFGGSYASLQAEVAALTGAFASCVIEVPETPIDNTGRGLGATRGDIEITVYPYSGSITLPDAPPVVRLGQGSYTDLPNFDDGAAGALAGNCVSTIDGAITNSRNELLAPQAGAVLRFMFHDCNNTAGGGGVPGVNDYIGFPYSADIDLANDSPTEGDATAITFFTNNIQPYLTGGTGVYAPAGIANSGELSLTLNIPAFRAGGAGSITLCVDSNLLLSTGAPSARASSVFESSAATVTMTVDDDDLEAVQVSMTATGCGGDLTADVNTKFLVQMNLVDPLGIASEKSPFVKIYFNGGTGLNGPLTFQWDAAINASDQAAFESCFSPLPSGSVRGFTYNKKALHTMGAGFDFVTNGNYTTKTTTTGNNYWAGYGAKTQTYADGSKLLEGWQNKLIGVCLYGGVLSSNKIEHTVRKGFLRTKSIALRFMPSGNAVTFANDEVRMGFAKYATYKYNSFPADLGLTFGFNVGGTEWYNLDAAATDYLLDGTKQAYSGSFNITTAGQATGAHTASLDAYFVGGLRTQAYIPLSVPDALDTDSLYRNPSCVAYPTEVIPGQDTLRLDFRIQQRAGITPAITSYLWTVKEVATGVSIDSGSGGSLTGSNTFTRNVSGSDIRTRALSLRIEFVYSGVTYYTEVDVKIEETF